MLQCRRHASTSGMHCYSWLTGFSLRRGAIILFNLNFCSTRASVLSITESGFPQKYGAQLCMCALDVQHVAFLEQRKPEITFFAPSMLLDCRFRLHATAFKTKVAAAPQLLPGTLSVQFLLVPLKPQQSIVATLRDQEWMLYNWLANLVFYPYLR